MGCLYDLFSFYIQNSRNAQAVAIMKFICRICCRRHAQVSYDDLSVILIGKYFRRIKIKTRIKFFKFTMIHGVIIEVDLSDEVTWLKIISEIIAVSVDAL